MIGISAPASTKAESRRLDTTIITVAPTNSTKLRSAIEMDVPAALIWVVSAVRRETSSPVLASSKKALDSEVMCAGRRRAVGDNAFAERRDEVVAKGACGRRQHRGNADHDQKIAVDEGDALGRKAEVDHSPNGDRHDQRRQRGNNQGAKRRQCAPAVAPDIG